MKFKRIAAAGGALAVGALVLSGCTTGDTDNGSGDSRTITVGVTNAATALNSGTPEDNLDTNGMLDYLTGNLSGPGSAFTLDPEFNIVRDETNVSYELVSDDPLVVTYTVDPEAVWSDGEPITTDDLLISWVIGSGYFDDATSDPETGDLVSGNQYFTLAGSTTGLDTTAWPEIDKEAGTFTLTYSAPYVDWEIVNLIGKPIHVLADKAGTTSEELVTLLSELPAGDPANPQPENETLRAVADFWNTGYKITAFPEDESLLVSAGPFVVSAFTPNDGGSVTLTPNPEWRGDELAYDQLILSFIGDANAQVTALRNEEVDIIAPQPSADTLTALEDAGAEIQLGEQLSYDHLDLNFNSPVFADPAVREAFLLTIPRQQILDSIITPVNPEADVLNSQIFIPAQTAYADATAVNGYSAFTEPDLARATELLAGATPTVRILYNSENPNRVDTFQAIQASAQEAGFVVVDGGSPTWGSELDAGNYDASIFGWISPGVGYAGLPQIWKTGGGGNYNGYSNSAVDALVDESQVTIGDEDRLTEIQIEIDTATAGDFYGLPLFQLPGLDASLGRVTGLEFFGGQTGVVWNAHTWTIAE